MTQREGCPPRCFEKGNQAQRGFRGASTYYPFPAENVRVKGANFGCH